MNGFKTQAYISSLNEGLITPTHKDEITVLEKVGDNDYIVDYKACAVMPFLIGLCVRTSQTIYMGGLHNERNNYLR